MEWQEPKIYWQRRLDAALNVPKTRNYHDDREKQLWEEEVELCQKKLKELEEK